MKIEEPLTVEQLEALLQKTPDMLRQLSGHVISYITHSVSTAIARAEDELQSRQWAVAGVKALEQLAAVLPGQAFYLELSAMNFRLNYLLHWGTSSGEPLLMPAQIMHWAFSNLPPVETIKTETEHWRSLPVERMAELRKIKLRIKMAQEIADKGFVTLSTAQQDYVAIRSLLP